MPKHISGPWKFWDRGADYVNSLITDATGNIGIARPIARMRADEVTIDEMRANAFLMTAAPELLDALEAFVDDPDHCDGDRHAALVRKAEAAIAKARGI